MDSTQGRRSNAASSIHRFIHKFGRTEVTIFLNIWESTRKNRTSNRRTREAVGVLRQQLFRRWIRMWRSAFRQRFRQAKVGDFDDARRVEQHSRVRQHEGGTADHNVGGLEVAMDECRRKAMHVGHGAGEFHGDLDLRLRYHSLHMIQTKASRGI
jgi:hypothetical protein